MATVRNRRGLRGNAAGWAWIEKAGQAVFQGAGEGEFGPELFAQEDGEFLQFHGNAFFRLGSGGGVAFELMPDLDDHFPRDGYDGDVALAFAGKEFPAPFP